MCEFSRNSMENNVGFHYIYQPPTNCTHIIYSQEFEIVKKGLRQKSHTYDLNQYCLLDLIDGSTIAQICINDVYNLPTHFQESHLNHGTSSLFTGRLLLPSHFGTPGPAPGPAAPSPLYNETKEQFSRSTVG